MVLRSDAPGAKQALGMGITGALQQQLKLVKMVDVEADSGQLENDQRLAGLFHSLAVWQKAVVAEA